MKKNPQGSKSSFLSPLLLTSSILLISIFLFSGCKKVETVLADTVHENILAWPDNLPAYDHIVIVVEENKDYEAIYGRPKRHYPCQYPTDHRGDVRTLQVWQTAAQCGRLRYQ